MTIVKKICYFFGKKKTNKEQNTSFLPGIKNKILTACYDLNCDNIVYLLHKSKIFSQRTRSIVSFLHNRIALSRMQLLQSSHSYIS